MALLHLVKAASPVPVFAASVNHGLRPEAASECEDVARLCLQLDISHDTLHWDGVHAGNLQSAARDARYKLLADWAKVRGISHIALGHTLDDQAETVLMRLGRGAGVDGLAGMSGSVRRHNVQFLRPMLHLRRADLQAYLQANNIVWRDDPSNDDPKYDRIRIRKAMGVLTDLGISPDALGQVAQNMSHAALALQAETRRLWRAEVTEHGGDLTVRPTLWKELGFEPARRLLLAMLRYVNRAAYPPRREEQRHLLQVLRAQDTATLAGCQITKGARFAREHRAVAEARGATTDIWDSRWQLSGPHSADFYIAALGDGITACPDWRDTGMPRASLLASPAIWQNDALIAAPLAGLQNGWTAQIVAESYSDTLTH